MILTATLLIIIGRNYTVHPTSIYQILR